MKKTTEAVRKDIWLIIIGIAALCSLIIVSNALPHYSNAQTVGVEYEGVLAQIEKASSSEEVYTLAENAGLSITSSTQVDSLDSSDTVSEILIRDPKSSAFLAQVTEYDDFFPLSDMASVPTSTATPIVPTAITITGPSSNVGQISIKAQADYEDSAGNYSAVPTATDPFPVIALAWSTGNVSSCSASGNWSIASSGGSIPLNGSWTSAMITSSVPLMFTITCQGSQGAVSSSARITFGTLNTASSASQSESALPIVTMSGSLSASAANTVLLTWSSQNASSCTASGAWSGSEPLSGTASQPLSSAKTSTYTLTCKGSGGTANASVSVSAPAAVSENAGNALRPLGLNAMFRVTVAYAQSTQSVTAPSTVVGNNTGVQATCSITGSNGTANVMVNADGSIHGITGNYNFVLGDNLGDGSNPSLAADATNAMNLLNAIGAPQGSLQGPLANQPANQITVTVGSQSDLVPGQNLVGVSWTISTLQPNGEIDNSSFANVIGDNISGSYITDTAVTAIYEHEMLHSMGLDHTSDQNNIMNPTVETATANGNGTLNTFQIQYLKDLATGKTITVDPSSCVPYCPSGSIYNGQTKTCSPKLPPITPPPSSDCSAADLAAGWIQTANGCVSPQQTGQNLSQPTSGCTPDQLANGMVNDGAGGCITPTTAVSSTISYPNDNDMPSSTTNPDTNPATCLDDNGNPYSCSATNCGGDGQLACPSNVPQGTCLDADGNPVDCSTVNQTDQSSDYCSQNPADPDCSNFCASDPEDSSCIGTNNSIYDSNYCSESPNDPSCSGGDTMSNGNDGDAAGGDSGDSGGGGGGDVGGSGGGCSFSPGDVESMRNVPVSRSSLLADVDAGIVCDE